MLSMNSWFKYFLIVLSLFLLSPVAVWPQTSAGPEKIAADYSEGLSLIVDRNIYLSGERIWFYADLFSNTDKLLSKTIYVELYSKDNSVQKKFSVEHGDCQGFIEIPEGINSGGYLLRAYTNYQKNFLPEQFAHQVLFILNPRKGIRKNGQHNISGAVLNNNVKKDSSFLPNTYAATLQAGHNSINRVAIDSAKGHYRIMLEPHNSNHTFNDLLLVVRNAQFKVALREQVQNAEIEIPRKILSSGINYFMLLKKTEPLITGVVFEKGSRVLSLKLDTEKTTYEPREKVKISFPANLSERHRQKAVVSVVRKATVFNVTDTAFVFKLMALNPHLLNDYQHIFPGFPALPDRYLKLAVQNHVDALIDQPSFINKIAHNSIEYLPEIYDLSISGHLEKQHDSVDLNDRTVYLSLFGENPQFHVYKTRDDGSFIFNIENSAGIHDLYLTTDPHKSGNVKIRVRNDFSGDFYPDKIPMLIDTSYRQLLEEMYLAFQLQRQFNTGDSTISKKFDVLPSIGRLAEVVELKDYVELPTMLEVLKEITPNVFVRKRDGKQKLFVFDEKRDFMYNEPLVLLDNLPVLNDETVFALDPAQVERINVIPAPYYVGDHKFNGVISVQTRTNDFGGAEFNGNSVFLQYTTYSPAAEFVQKLPEKHHLPYFSNLLFWQVADFGNVQKSFVAPDNEGAYEVIMRFSQRLNDNVFWGKKSFLIQK
ncbi:hypothetical protein [Salinivirga cyanobacteriivorans]|nr:hypothetical protein [Salinivirga cyanobacteriivorans]